MRTPIQVHRFKHRDNTGIGPILSIGRFLESPGYIWLYQCGHMSHFLGTNAPDRCPCQKC